MNSGISKKFIVSFFLYIIFIQTGKSAELNKFTRRDNNSLTNKLRLPSLLNKTSKTSDFSNNKIEEIFFYEKNSDPLLADIRDTQKEVVIQSEMQSEINDVIYAKGNVSVSFKGKILRADNLTYDKLNKKISAKGNVVLILGDQIFKVSEIEYSFISEKGYLLNVKGSIKTNNLINDLSSNFSISDSQNIENLLEFKKKEVLNTPGKVENWIFSSDKITIDGKKWKSIKAVFSNDLLELKQVKLVINSLEVISEEEDLRFNSSLNYLVFENKLSIPFWIGNRTLSKSGEFFSFENRWNLGYENFDKDGYFIGRKFNSLDIFGDFVVDLEPQFLIQRSLQGYTESFVGEGESITSEKVKRDASFEDYFALRSQMKGSLNNWDLEIEKNLNSFDFDKFSDAFRFQTKLSKEINFLNSKWEKSLYGIYRKRVWNGSLGEAEIYSAYGSKLQKENTWVVNGIKKTEVLSFGLADIRAEALNTTDLVTNLKGNVFYSLDQNFPIFVDDPTYKYIDASYKYIPAPISKGLSLNTRLEASYSFYENGEHQEYIGLGIGPELVLGNFKNKIFDYTRLSLIPFYKFDSGESVFKFDNNIDKFTLNIALDQQLYGPIIFKSIGKLNLTKDSDDYGEFIDSKISVIWKKRSYEFGIFYQPQNQAGGISFELFGFK